MKIYNLYLDESETHDAGKNRCFSIAGIIVEDTYDKKTLEKDLNNLKKNIWPNEPNFNNFILHEKDIRNVMNNFNKPSKLNSIKKEYHIFKATSKAKILYTGLEKIIRQPEIKVIGGCILFDELHKNFPKNVLPDKSSIALQIILENFCHFLTKNNGVGRVFYESIGEAPDNAMRMRFYNIKAIGTMYIHPSTIQKLILDISFPEKKDNVSGLQIADFIPNHIVRNAINKPKHRFNLNKPIKKALYCGGLNRPDKFGVKILPRIQ